MQDMSVTTITISAQNSQVIRCSSCQATDRYYVVTDQWPHLYCSYCHNVYVDIDDYQTLNKIHSDNKALKAMELIEGAAKLCPCGGMFLFHVQVHCIHCGEVLPFQLPTDPRQRIRYGDLVVFDGSEIVLGQGQGKLYHLTK